jgi:hypothetical protein
MSAFNGSPQVGGITNIPRRAYITTTAFNNDFYTYTVSMNPTTFVTTGTLAANVVGATAVTCPANRILRENGKRLYPEGANPGVNTLMVGVYDTITGFKGYIDPNAPPFAVYNSDKSYQTPNGINPNGSLVDQGPPIFTRGPTRLYGGVDVSGGLVVVGGMLRDSSTTALTTIVANGAATAQTVDPNLGEIYTFTASPPSGVASITLNGANITGTTGARVTLLITATTAFNTTITFGTGFFKTATLIVTAAAGPVTQYYSISFISNGTNLFELSRTAAQT